jgi:hypothetical protein
MSAFKFITKSTLHSAYVGEANNTLLAQAGEFLREEAVSKLLDLARADAQYTTSRIQGNEALTKQWLQVRSVRSVSTVACFSACSQR